MISFTTMVIADLALIFANRSRTRTILATLRKPNPALWWVTGGTLLFLVLALFVPYLRGLFGFAPLHVWEIAVIGGTGLLSILVSESVKTRLFRRVLGGGKEMEAMPEPQSVK
jgi:Ca2+-transporting ATPase